MADPNRQDDANRVGVYDDTTETTTTQRTTTTTTDNSKSGGVGVYDRPERSGSPMGTIIGIILFILAAVAIYYFFFRQPQPRTVMLENPTTHTLVLEETLVALEAFAVAA